MRASELIGKLAVRTSPAQVLRGSTLVYDSSFMKDPIMIVEVTNSKLRYTCTEWGFHNDLELNAYWLDDSWAEYVARPHHVRSVTGIPGTY
jgi:hypothetical protein